MQVLVAGGTGFIGRALVQELLAAGHGVVVLTRRAVKEGALFPPPVTIRRWSPREPLRPSLLAGADAVVNLAGASIARRWTQAAKREILSSRTETTAALVKAMQASSSPPRVLVNASAVGYYGPRGDEFVTETDPPGEDFLARVCREWEAAATAAEAAGVRVVRLRIGLVLGRGGALARMSLPFRFFVGGPIGSGKQWMPWIHIDDLTGLIRFALEEDSLRGAVNGTAPNPVRNRDFARTLGRVLRRPALLPAPAFALRLVFGEMAEMLLTGQRAIPKAALAAGFRFRFTELEPALRAIYGG